MVKPNYLPSTINAKQMRQVNRSAILELIRQHSPIARSEISQLLHLSLPTIIRIVDELIEDDLVRSTGLTSGETGRPRELLEYNISGNAVIGIDLGGTKLYGALANIGGEILGEVYKGQHSSSGESSYFLIQEIITSLSHLSSEMQQKLLGIAIGVPGVTHVDTGVVEWAPSLNWKNFPLKQRIADQFHLPVMIDNDVNLAAFGEQWFGAGRGVNNLVLLAIGTGMGAGLIVDGVIYRGHTEAAGEVGYFLPGIDALSQRYDHFGAMESIISGPGIVERARWLLRDSVPAAELNLLTTNAVFEAARNSEDWAIQIIDETRDYLSMVIANITTLLDPELIILSGGVSNSLDYLIQPILSRLDGVIQHIPRLEISTLGEKATVMGAISIILHLTKDYYILRRLL